MNPLGWVSRNLIGVAVGLVLLALAWALFLGRCIGDAGTCSSVIGIGVFTGMIIALIAIGYTLVYGILQLINFANGDVFMLGSAVTLIGVQVAGLTSQSELGPILLTFAILLPLTMLLTAGLNAGIERAVYRPLRRAPTLATLIAAIGMSFILQNVGLLLIGPSPVSLPEILPNVNIVGKGGWFQLGGLQITASNLFVTLITLPLLAWLMWFVRSTRQGKAMRAVAQDREAAGLMGIDINRTISLTFLLAGALAGGAGLVVALVNGQAWWFYGTPFGLLAFTAAVFGGIGNLAGATLGALILGVVISLNQYYNDARWQDIFVFGILVLILVFKPTGLLAQKQSERA